MTTSADAHSIPVTIRTGQTTLSFLVSGADGTMKYHFYPVKEEMSVAANLREAFRNEPYLQESSARAVLSVTTPVILMPMSEYACIDDFDADAAYGDLVTGHKGERKILREVKGLDAMAIFPVNNDLHMVVADHYPTVEVHNVMIPVWEHLYSRYYRAGMRRRVFVYFHDRKMDICSFENHRVRFANVFDNNNDHDALYYILYVWKQLGLNQREDELHAVGDISETDWLFTRLHSYISRVYIINPSANLNRSPLAQIPGMPFDMML